MIGIDGQFLLDIKSEELNKDLSYFGKLHSFVAIEECGLLLPVFNICFSLKDLKNLSYFHEGSIIKAAFGKNKKDLKYINLHVIECSILDSSTEEKVIKLVATLFKPTYSKNTKIKIYKNKCSLDVMKSILNEYFQVKTNLDLTSDRQNWIQYGISDKAFVEYLWYNSYLDNGFLALGCSAIDNMYVIKDIVKEFTKLEYDYRFANGKKDSKDVVISKVRSSKGNFGFYNTWAANDFDSLNYNLSTDTFSSKSYTINTLLSTSNKNPRNSLVEKNVSKITLFANDKYSKSKKYNIFALANYSKYNVEIELIDELYPIKLLDKIYLDLNKEIETNSEFFSGNYLVTSVVRSIANNTCITKVILTRESPGNLRGKYL